MDTHMPPGLNPDDDDISVLPDFLRFTPVPMQHYRCDGWTPKRQEQFVKALSVMGSISAAARAVSKSSRSAYTLRARPGAQSFARAWDTAQEMGQDMIFSYQMDRAMNGVTTIRIQRSGSVSISGGVDQKLVNASMRQDMRPQRRMYE
jgi:hypothetical protein